MNGLLRVVWATGVLLVAAPALAGPKLDIVEATACRSVVDGEAIGAGDHFPADVGRLQFYVRVRNPGPGDSRLYVEWQRGGKRLNTYDYALPAGRTVPVASRRKLPADPVGDWAVRLYDGDRRLLRTVAFRVDPAGAPVAEVQTLANTPPPPPDGTCRAVVDLAAGDGDSVRYEVAEVTLSGEVNAVTARGVVVRDGAHTWALHVVPFQGMGGVVRQQWDMLYGVELPGGEPRLWHGYPATLSVASPPADHTPFYETNRLRILNVFGPYVALRATLRVAAPGSPPADHSRYVTLRAPGRVADPLALVTDVDRRAFVRVIADRASGGLPDLRRSTLVMRGARLHLATLAPRADDPLSLESPVAGVASGVREWLPDGAGVYTAPDRCGAIAFADGRLVIRAPAPHPLDIGPYTALLGVHWLRPGEPSVVDALRSLDDAWPGRGARADIPAIP